MAAYQVRLLRVWTLPTVSHSKNNTIHELELFRPNRLNLPHFNTLRTGDADLRF